jgi:hypothetical protein
MRNRLIPLGVLRRTDRSALLCAVILVGCLFSLSSRAEVQERLSVISNGQIVGHLQVRETGENVHVDYLVRENGRGPTAHEDIQFGAKGLPNRWTIAGTSLVDAPTREFFEVNGGRAHWVTEADRGETASPGLYLASDGSPWDLGMYARVLLHSQDRQLEILPFGRLRLESAGTNVVGAGAGAVTGTAYRLIGAWLTPQYVVLSGDEKLLAAYSEEGSIIREGFEGSEAVLKAFKEKLAIQWLRELQSKLAHRYAQPVRLKNVHVFDPEAGRVGSLVSVVVFRDRIVGVGPDEPSNVSSDEVEIDGEGGTIIPGLHDMHSHTSLDTGLYNLAAGVTATRDMGNNNEFLLDLMPRFEDGELAGPRITSNGFIEGKSPYSEHLGFVVDNLADALRDVQWYADRGYWQLKVYNSIDPQWVKPMAAEAHRLGMTVTGHIPAFTTADRMIADGYDEVTHINQLMFEWVLAPNEDTRTTLRITGLNRLAAVDLESPRVKQTIALMRAHHTVLDTTAIIQERLALSRAGRVQPGDVAYIDHMPVAYQRYRKRNFVVTTTAAAELSYEQAVSKILETIKLLYDNGIRLMPGTDDYTGVSLHRELELYVKAGIPAAETLRLATLGAAQYLKQSQDYGTIERGKVADLVLLPGDPIKDISLVRRARLVMRGGVVYYPSEIYAALSVKPFSTSPPAHQPPLDASVAESAYESGGVAR